MSAPDATTLLGILSSIPADNLVEGTTVHVTELDGTGHTITVGASVAIPPDYWDTKPGDMFALDADVTLYWPWVRPCWEDRP